MVDYYQKSNLGQYLSPPKWARQPLISWFASATRVLGVLCLMHFGLRGANQARQSRPVANSSTIAIAEGKKEEAEGHFARALQAFQRAERLAREAQDLQTQAFALVSIGVCQIGLFEYRAAVAALENCHLAGAAPPGESPSASVPWDGLGAFPAAPRSITLELSKKCWACT